jgi:hypothetical protein
MSLLRALSLPFQLTSLLFVGFIALPLAFVSPVGGTIQPGAIIATYILLSWLNKYAFAVLDHAANGSEQAPVASVELLGPFGDWRAWVHPLLGCGVFVLSFFVQPVVSKLLALFALLLFPLSIGALAISHHPPDALNPLAWWRVLCALGSRYLLLLGAMALVVACAAALWQWPMWDVLRKAGIALLLLAYYALLGGTLHERRIELGFEPTRSPEREADADEQERQRQRQRCFDEVYTATRVREYLRAATQIDAWLGAQDNRHLWQDVHALIEHTASWPEARAMGAVLRAALTLCLRQKQPALALQVLDAILKRIADFAPLTLAETQELASFAQQTGRPRLAQTLRENFAARKT